jgi:hypothetical protein
MSYFEDKITRIDNFDETEQNPLDVKLEDTLLIAFTNDKGIVIRHRQSLTPVMLKEIGEKIMIIAKRLQQ